MNYRKKVVWSEGMFLRPQHFQQQERYTESYIQQCMTAFTGFFWGFGALEIDPGALTRGTILVRRAWGVLPDGTPFDLNPEEPLALDVSPEAKNVKICLALPPLQAGVKSVIYDEDNASVARFRAVTLETGDNNESGAEPAEIQVARCRFRLMPETEVPNGWMALGMLKLVERQTNNVLKLNPEYIPPTLCCGAEKNLSAFLGEIVGLLKLRGDAMSGRLSAGGRGGIAEIGEFLILMLINRWQPLIAHLERIKILHPERLYANLLGLAGELATFSAAGKRAPAFMPYDHDNLEKTFSSLMIELRQALAIVIDQTVIQIELRDHKQFGIRTAVVPDKTLFRQASFILAAHAEISPEKMQGQLPAQVKIGPIERIRDLVNLQLPGIILRPLPVAPRELPFHAGYNYFELDTQQELWQELEKSAGMALHIAGNFPGLDLECWAIRK